MGTGKTAVAKALAKKLEMEYVSMDERIEQKVGKPINDIFTEYGEPYFRMVESEMIEDLSARDNIVIDAGGGVVLDEKNIQNLKHNGTLVCLNALPGVIYERTKHYAHRPLLNVADPEKKIQELLDFRAPFYKKADHQVDTSQKSIEEVVQEVMQLVGR
jgi:shikimate kinase